MAKKIMSKKEMLKEKERLKKEKRQLSNGYENDDLVKSFIKITIGVGLFLFIAFAGMNLLKGNWKFNKEEITIDDTISNGVICGTLLNQEEPEYFVMAYNHSSDDKTFYEGLVGNYQGPNHIYNMDLDSGFNKSCVGDKTVTNKDLAKVKIASPTLLSIKNRKIEKVYTKKEDIMKTLTSTN